MLSILQIEKSNFFIRSFKEIVIGLGHNVISVSNVEKAFDILENNNIDLIVTAISGNEMLFDNINGTEFKDIPILVLTSTDNRITRQKLFELGILDYIVKDTLTAKKLKRYLTTFHNISELSSSDRLIEIAVLDDSLFSLRVISKILSNSPFTNITYFSEAEDLLKSEKTFTIYLIDLVLKNVSGEEVLLRLRERSPNTIIIMMSVIDNYKTTSNVLMLGANDFLAKPFDRNYFLARINSHLRTYLLRQDLEAKNILLKNMAITDGLTGLYNHKFILERLKEEYERASRYSTSLTVAMLDIDNFKKINDDYGHPVGDKILIEFSQLLKSTLRDSDLIGRYGGEEFLIVFPESNVEEAYIACEKIRIFVQDHVFEDINRRVTISAGLCDNTATVFNGIITAADKNLYGAKNSGRNKTCK